VAVTVKKLLMLPGVFLTLGAQLCLSQGLLQPLDFATPAQLFSTEFLADGPGQLREARLKSELDLSLGEDLLALEVDYKLQGKADQAQPAALVSQQIVASLDSGALEKLLDVDLGLEAQASFRESVDSYHYQLTPSVTRAFSDLARLQLNYQYVLDKAAPLAREQERRGYAMLLDGSARDGRLTWSGSYRNTSVFQERLLLTGSTQALELKSRYQLADTFHLELSSALRHQAHFGEVDPQLSSVKRYTAGFGWSPSARYALAFRLNNLDEQREQQRQEAFGSGSLSWFPRPDLEFTLDYGEQLVEGSAGWMVHTRFDLNG
jgi:hypothetical protein